VWDLQLRKDQLLLESVEHFALKIASWSWNLDYQTLCTHYNLAPLTKRSTFKFLHDLFIALEVIYLRLSHSKQLVQPFAR